MCVDWRKALRSMWHVDPLTNCALITAVSNQIPLILSLIFFRELLNGQGTLNLEPCILSWKYNLTNFKNDIYTLNELIDIRDGIKECNGFITVEISRFILNICTR